MPIVESIALQTPELRERRVERLAAIDEPGLPARRDGVAAKERWIERHAGLKREPLVALAVELAPDVRALCICPGPVATDMMEDAVRATSDPEAARRQWANFPLLSRVARPTEIAEAIVFAASPAASFATGSIIAIDGGTTAGKRV